jgi:hypothetical protein
MLYAMTNGTLNFNYKPFSLARGGFYVNTNAFGGSSGSNGTIITLTASAGGGGGAPTPSGGGLNNPFGTGLSSGNGGSGGPTIFTPNPVSGTYVMNITPPNSCAVPGKVKFVIDQNGNISPSSVEYGLSGSGTYLGELSGDVYAIDNQNSGITFSAVPRSLLKNCVNSITITTTSGNDYVITSGENLLVSVPSPGAGSSISYGQLKIYNAVSSSLAYTSSTLTAGTSTLNPGLSNGVYRFELPVTASGTPSVSETLKGQLIVK